MISFVSKSIMIFLLLLWENTSFFRWLIISRRCSPTLWSYFVIDSCSSLSLLCLIQLSSKTRAKCLDLYLLDKFTWIFFLFLGTCKRMLLGLETRVSVGIGVHVLGLASEGLDEEAIVIISSSYWLNKFSYVLANIFHSWIHKLARRVILLSSTETFSNKKIFPVF